MRTHSFHDLCVYITENSPWDSVISVKLYSTSFFSFFFLLFTKNILPSLKSILIESIVGKISSDDF